jgi:hypothetical protein
MPLAKGHKGGIPAFKTDATLLMERIIAKRDHRNKLRASRAARRRVIKDSDGEDGEGTKAEAAGGAGAAGAAAVPAPEVPAPEVPE